MMFEPYRAMVLFNPMLDLLATQLPLNPIWFGVISRIQLHIWSDDVTPTASLH
jgi:TRAP-type C4-dicarboxylate transport system permease large subunit